IKFEKTNLNYEKLIEYLPDGFNDLIEFIEFIPVYEQIELVIAFFKLENYSSEEVYLHAFLDFVQENHSRNNLDLSTFMDVWNDEGRQKSVSVSENSDAIRILTVHKSKGLEFPVVIMPFCNWKLEPRSGNLLWLKSELPPLNQMPFFPVAYSSKLSESIFFNEYHEEHYRNIVDNLNLLYVAFTRAGSALFTFSVYSSKGGATVGNWMNATLSNMHHAELKNSDNAFSFGKLKSIEQKEELFEENRDAQAQPKQEVAFGFRKRKTSLDWEESELTGNLRVQGVIWHALFERIQTIDDIEKAVVHQVNEGVIPGEKKNYFVLELQKMIEKDTVTDWFSGKYRVLNEVNIILPGKGFKRPDRVMIHDEQVVIVDYKTSKHEPAHEFQVKSYLKVVKEMGFKKVKGYLWYLMDDNIVEVAN
ncbi:MAG: Dna2/Cas4 domain-containing protein, partial [Bacteroidales bacterium]|nr:Dna2/Cas4 domain-containing protein [Bacteroidales bacterium]